MRIDGLEIEHIADLLMGAAHADGHLEGIEVKTVLAIIVELLEGRDVPASLIERLNDFDPSTFDVERACQQLGSLEDEQKRSLLALLARVSEADEIHDLDEGAFIRQVARLVEADDELLEGMAAEVSISASSDPPPVPEA